MAETSRVTEVKADDADLSITVKKIVRFFRLNGKLLLIASLTGLFCGIILHIKFPKHFAGELLIESTVLNNLEQGELIDNWTHLAGTNDNLLSQQLGCSLQTAQNIVSFSSEALPSLPDGTFCFILTVNVRDTSQLQAVQDAIISGMRNNPFVKQKVAIRLANLENEISGASEEIARLDSSKDLIGRVAQTQRREGNPSVIEVFDVAYERVEIAEKLGSYKERQAFGKGVSLVLGFSALKGPKPGLLTLLAAGLLGGFLIGYFAAAFKSLIQLSKQ